MKLYNTLSRKIEAFKPIKPGHVSLYSCGPTVYDNIHIGNLSAFIAADTLRRTLVASGQNVKHVMNFTDIDDKTIRRSKESYPNDPHDKALKILTEHYSQIFLKDMAAIGNNISSINFVNATDSIDKMQQLIKSLIANNFAYITEDGIYFSIDKYRKSGKKYGQLLELTESSTSDARINNDEYDKESVHDFALWKLRKGNEPAWEFNINGLNLLGRPGWHIECSAMSETSLSQPFDIHTGGIDLIFPHHENEIAQSTAGRNNDIYAKYFVHNEHLLVDGRKMSKSLNNFFTLKNIREKGYDPLAFRLMVLQSHYRSQSNFTWENLQAAQNRLSDFRAFADLKYQDSDEYALSLGNTYFSDQTKAILESMSKDLDTPGALTILNTTINRVINEGRGLSSVHITDFADFLIFADELLGLELSSRPDITAEQKRLIAQRQIARNKKDWKDSDSLRDKLKAQGIGLRDSGGYEQLWYRL